MWIFLEFLFICVLLFLYAFCVFFISLVFCFKLFFYLICELFKEIPTIFLSSTRSASATPSFSSSSFMCSFAKMIIMAFFTFKTLWAGKIGGPIEVRLWKAELRVCLNHNQSLPTTKSRSAWRPCEAKHQTFSSLVRAGICRKFKELNSYTPVGFSPSSTAVRDRVIYNNGVKVWKESIEEFLPSN